MCFILVNLDKLVTNLQTLCLQMQCPVLSSKATLPRLPGRCIRQNRGRTPQSGSSPRSAGNHRAKQEKQTCRRRKSGQAFSCIL